MLVNMHVTINVNKHVQIIANLAKLDSGLDESPTVIVRETTTTTKNQAF